MPRAGGLRAAAGAPPASGWSWPLPLAAIVLLALLLRLPRLEAASLWTDEVFTAYWIRQEWAFLWGEGMRLEPNPPLYYSLLKAWTGLLGAADEATLRLFSVVVSVATIPVVALLGRDFGGRRVGLLAATLFALAPVQVYYAQEARTYALLILLTAIATLAMTRFARSAASGRVAAGWLLPYAAAAVGMVYAHATAAILLAALNLCCLGWLLLQPRWPGAVARLVTANAVVLLAAVPQILVMLGQLGRHDHAFMQPLHLVQLLNLGNTLLVDPNTPLFGFRETTILMIVVAGLFALVLLLARADRMAWVFLAGVPAVFFALALLIGLKQPILIGRVIAWMSVPVCVLAALALLSPRAPALLRGAFALALAAATVVGLHGVYTRTALTKEDWRGMIAELRERVAPGDLLVYGPTSGTLSADIYGPLAAEPTIWVPPGQPHHAFPPLRRPPQPVTSEDLARAAAEGRRVWLLMWYADWGDFGAAATEAVRDRPPRVERHRAGLTLLSW